MVERIRNGENGNERMDINMVHNTDVCNEFSGLVRFVECIE